MLCRGPIENGPIENAYNQHISICAEKVMSVVTVKFYIFTGNSKCNLFSVIQCFCQEPRGKIEQTLERGVA